MTSQPFNIGEWSPGERRLIRFALGREDQEHIKRGVDQDRNFAEQSGELRNRYERAVERGNAILRRIDQIASEAERKGGNAGQFRIIEKYLKAILQQSSVEMGQARRAGLALIERTLRTRELEDPETGRLLTNLEASAKAISLALGMREAVIRELTNTIQQQTTLAGTEWRSLNERTTELEEETTQQLASLSAARDGLFGNREHRAVQQEVNRARAELERIQRESGYARLVTEKDKAKADLDAATTLRDAQKTKVEDATKAVTDAETEKGKLAELRTKLEQHDQKITDTQTQIDTKGREIAAAAEEARVRGNIPPAELAKVRTGLNDYITGRATAEKAAIPAATPAAEKTTRETAIDQARDQRLALAKTLKDAEDEHARLTAEKARLVAETPAKEAEINRIDAATTPAKIRELKEKQKTAQGVLTALEAQVTEREGKFNRLDAQCKEKKPQIDGAEQTKREAEEKLRDLSARVPTRTPTKLELKNYLDGPLQAALRQLREEGNHIHQNFEEAKEDRILQIFEEQRALLVERAEGREALKDDANQAASIEKLLQAIDGEMRFLERHHSTDHTRHQTLLNLQEQWAKKLEQVYGRQTDALRDSPEKLAMVEKEIKFLTERGVAGPRMDALQQARNRILNQMYAPYRTETTKYWDAAKGDKFASYGPEPLKHLFEAMRKEYGFLHGHGFMPERQDELRGYGRAIRVEQEKRRLGGLETASEKALKGAATTDLRAAALENLAAEAASLPEGEERTQKRMEKIRQQAHEQRDTVVTVVNKSVQEALTSTDSKQIRSAVEEAMRERAMLDRYFGGTKVREARLKELLPQLDALFARLQETTDRNVTLAKQSPDDPALIRKGLEDIDEEKRLLSLQPKEERFVQGGGESGLRMVDRPEYVARINRLAEVRWDLMKHLSSHVDALWNNQESLDSRTAPRAAELTELEFQQRKGEAGERPKTLAQYRAALTEKKGQWAKRVREYEQKTAEAKRLSGARERVTVTNRIAELERIAGRLYAVDAAGKYTEADWWKTEAEREAHLTFFDAVAGELAALEPRATKAEKSKVARMRENLNKAIDARLRTPEQRAEKVRGELQKVITYSNECIARLTSETSIVKLKKALEDGKWAQSNAAGWIAVAERTPGLDVAKDIQPVKDVAARLTQQLADAEEVIKEAEKK